MARNVQFATVSATALVCGLALAAGSAHAQGTVDEVVVTGSYIGGTAEDAALPVDVIRAEDLRK